MTRYNKAFQGGLGAAVAVIMAWLAEAFMGVTVPVEITGALAVVLAGLFPAFGPANRE